MDLLENYVLELYGCRDISLAAARLDKFNKSNDNDLRSLPPSKDALRQHVLRACYQAGYLWRQSIGELHIPDLKDWGLEQESVGAFFNPVLTTEKSPVTITEFIKTCSCKTGKCKILRAIAVMRLPRQRKDTANTSQPQQLHDLYLVHPTRALRQWPRKALRCG